MVFNDIFEAAGTTPEKSSGQDKTDESSDNISKPIPRPRKGLRQAVREIYRLICYLVSLINWSYCLPWGLFLGTASYGLRYLYCVGVQSTSGWDSIMSFITSTVGHIAMQSQNFHQSGLASMVKDPAAMLSPSWVTAIPAALNILSFGVDIWRSKKRTPPTDFNAKFAAKYPALNFTSPISMAVSEVLPDYISKIQANILAINPGVVTGPERELHVSFASAEQRAQVLKELNGPVMDKIRMNCKGQHQRLRYLQSQIEQAAIQLSIRNETQPSWYMRWVAGSPDRVRAQAHSDEMASIIKDIIKARGQEIRDVEKAFAKISPNGKSSKHGAICELGRQIRHMGNYSDSKMSNDDRSALSVMCDSSISSDRRWDRITGALQKNLRQVETIQFVLQEVQHDQAGPHEVFLTEQGKLLLEGMQTLERFGN